MPGVAHDLLVRHGVAIGRRDEPGAQAMRADRLVPGSRDARLSRLLERDLADSIGAEPTKPDRAATVDLSLDRPVVDASLGQPFS